MENRKTGQSTGSTASASGGSAGTRGRAGRDQDENARVADTSPGDLRTGSQASEGALGGPGVRYTAAERGAAGLEKVPGMEGQARRWEAGTGSMARETSGGSEEYGMDQVSRVLREAREEGDPELQMREEDLHARQQNLGERERSLKERDEQLRMREQGLRERQSSITGRGLGATDYRDYRIQNDR